MTDLVPAAPVAESDGSPRRRVAPFVALAIALVLAGLFVASSFAFLLYAARAYDDIPFLALVATAAAIEAEIATMPAEDRAEFLSDLGLTETGLSQIIRAGYDPLHLITFFTAGPKESRAWTVEKGAKAPQAAGAIHTDFERGFIRAETIAYDDYVALGGEAGARDGGKLRLEGKEYVVADGDVMNFRFAT